MLTDHLKSIPLMKFKILECNFSRENATVFSNSNHACIMN